MNFTARLMNGGKAPKPDHDAQGFPEDERASDPDITSEVTVDPWTGQVISPPGPMSSAPHPLNQGVGPRIPGEPQFPAADELSHQETLEVNAEAYAARLRGEPAPVTKEVDDFSAALPQLDAPAISEWSSTQSPGESEPPTKKRLSVAAVVFVAAIASIIGAGLGVLITLSLLPGHESEQNTSSPTVVEPPSQQIPQADPPQPTDPAVHTAPAANAPPPAPTSPAPTSPAPTSPAPDGQQELTTTATEPGLENLPEKLTLPMEFRRWSAEPVEVDEASLRKIADFMIADRTTSFVFEGFATADEGEDALKRLGYRRAINASGLIGRLGPSRRRFQAKSGGVAAKRAVILHVRRQ